MMDWLSGLFGSGSSTGSTAASGDSSGLMWLPTLITAGAGLLGNYSNRKYQEEADKRRDLQWQQEFEWKKEIEELRRAQEEAQAQMQLEAALAAIRQRMYGDAIHGLNTAGANYQTAMANLIGAMQRPYVR